MALIHQLTGCHELRGAPDWIGMAQSVIGKGKIFMRYEYKHEVLDRYVDKLRAMRKQRQKELAAIQTREEALAYQQKVREAITHSFGPWPEKCPLDPVVSGIIQREGFRIEKVRYSSRPGYWVTGNLYIPDNLPAPAPAVVQLCGHDKDGKGCEIYQQFCIRLVNNGFCAFILDPAHQGERELYPGMTDIGVADGLCAGHNVVGKQLELVGETFGSWRLWDARCALDYLLTRPEIDGSRLGIAGNSGGGTLTEWTWANDDRLAFAAPSCHVTTFMHNLENELPTDAEQCPPEVLANSLEMVDMLICQAPKPVLLLGQKYDFFECRGLKEAYGELKRFYELLGADGKAQLFIGPRTHGLSVENQEAIVRFFRKTAGLAGEPVILENPETLAGGLLNVCESGCVKAKGSLLPYDLASQKADKLAAERRVPEGRTAWQNCVKQLLDFPELPAEVPYYRVLRADVFNEVVWARYAIETEDNIRAIMKKRLVCQDYYNTLDVDGVVNLYLPDCSSEYDLLNCEVLKKLAPGENVYVLDVRGLGESMPQEATVEHFLDPYGADYMMHSFGLMFGESYLGRRVFDVCRTIQLLKHEGASGISLTGRGQGAVIAVFTAILCDEVSEVVLYDAPASYREWIDGKVCDWPAANVPFGVLKFFDLPDLYAALGEKLTIASYWNNLRR